MAGELHHRNLHAETEAEIGDRSPGRTGERMIFPQIPWNQLSWTRISNARENRFPPLLDILDSTDRIFTLAS
ncbi:hypothetical protein MASR1M66_02070 [Aminivibrio sp.]